MPGGPLRRPGATGTDGGLKLSGRIERRYKRKSIVGRVVDRGRAGRHGPNRWRAAAGSDAARR
jgi:hypothetical protein